MTKQDGKEKKIKNKKESKLVNKESFCATVALFSILLLLILCTRTLIFGEFGGNVHAFLTGVFGYFAYPLAIGLLYLSAFGLFGKRLVKNRKLFCCCALLVASAALIVHIALTYSWFEEGDYLAACFNAGENFPKTTVCGWVGGALAYGVAKVTTKIGALIVYGIITVFLTYVCITVASKQPTQRKQQKTAQPQSADGGADNAEIPLYQQPVPAAQPQSGQTFTQASAQAQSVPADNGFGYGVGGERVPMPGYASSDYRPDAAGAFPESVREEIAESYTPTVAQRPGFTLREEENKEFNKDRAFSPFGMPVGQEQTDERLPDYGNSRDFLFGGTPAENYQRNLIFDPTAKVNNRPAEPQKHPTIHDGYTPSYTGAYQNALNDTPPMARPMKIVNDQTQSGYGYNNRFEDYAKQEATPPPVVQAQPMEEKPYLQEWNPYPQGGEETRDSYRLSEGVEPAKPVDPVEPSSYLSEEGYGERSADGWRGEDTREDTRGEELDRGRGDGYRRHDYMDLFSTDNPNVFGGEQETLLDRAVGNGRVARDIDERNFDDRSIADRGRSDRNFDREDSLSDERDFRLRDYEENSRGYDETPRGRDGLHLLDEDDTYSLRADYTRSDDGEGGFDVYGREDGNTDGRGADMRGRGYDEVVDGSRATSARRNPTEDLSGVAPYDPTPAVTPKATENAPAVAPPKPRVIRPYVRVPLDDFDCRDVQPSSNDEEVEETKQNILATLAEFRVTGAEIASVTFGPTVTRYNVAIPRSISPKKVVALDQSIAISLHSSGVNVYPNYEDGVVSIEVPNKERQFVQLGCMLSGDTFVNAKPSSLMFAMGKDVANRKVYGDMSKMIHLLVAGSSGSGKSVFLGSLIVSLIYKYSPEELRLILIDPKMTEFVLYNGLPHLMINEIITDANKAVQSLNWAIGEMNRRYQLFEKMSRSGTYVVNLDQYNAQVEKAERLPKIVIIIDELADLMLAAKKEMEDRIQNLTQKARAAGIHLIVATQRPSTDVITGVIKSNLPTRVAFYVATDVDSRVILDQTGAQKLLGKGDFLYTMPGLAAPVRVQSAFISPEESQRVVNFIKNNNEAYYDEEATAFINARGAYAGDPSDPLTGDRNGAVDPVYIEALKYVILSGSASISMIQRKCSTGYSRAGKIIEWMEDMGYISPFDGAKARKVLITKEEFESKYGSL